VDEEAAERFDSTMPKVISLRPMIFSNTRERATDTLNSFKCKSCDNICLITDVKLYGVPKRKTDNAVILNLEKDICRMRTKEIEEVVKIKRAKGKERQYQHACANCGEIVAYQCVPHGTDCKVLYVKQDTMRIPWNKMITPFVCKICGFMAKDKESLVAHQKQRQHFWEEEKQEEAENKPNMTSW